MKQAIFALVGVVLGFMLGGIQPRRALVDKDGEISRLQDELVEARRRSRRTTMGRSVLPGLDGMLPAPELDEETEEEPAIEDVDGDDGEEDPGEVEGVGSGPEAVGEPQDVLDEFDLAADAQRLRAEQNLASLQQEFDLEEADLIELDRVFADMNDALAEHATDVLDMTMSGEEPTASDLLGISHDVTGILHESQVALDDVVGVSGSTDPEDPTTQVWNYIDLEVFRPAVEELASEQSGGGVRGRP